MNFIFNINSLIAAIFLFYRGFADQSCGEGSPDQIVIFSNLDDLRSSEIPFKAGSSRFQGNRIIIDGPTFKKLEKKSFICDTCEFIAALNLTGHKIEEVEDGAFENLRCLKNLDMSSNDILKIQPETFAELRTLEVLNFRTNNVEILKNMTFAKNYNLTELDLTSNYIKYIEYNAFYNLTLLKLLYLRDNDITYLDFEIFFNVPKLERLDLSFNKLLKIEPPREFFHNSLNHLDISHNQLTEGIEHIYMPKVMRIILTGNKIKKMDVVTLYIHCISLESIELSDNNWECAELATMEKELQEHNVTYGKSVKCVRNIHAKYSDYYSPQVLQQQVINKVLTIVLMVIIAIFVVYFIYHFVVIHVRERDVCSKWFRFCSKESNPTAQNEEVALVATTPQV